MSDSTLRPLFDRLNQQQAAEPAPSQAPDTVPGEKMGERFVRLGLLTEDQVQHVVQLQQAERLRFGQAAVKLGFVSEARVQSVLAEQYRYDYAPAQQGISIWRSRRRRSAARPRRSARCAPRSRSAWKTCRASRWRWWPG
ncbi:hypothetical protein WJ972_24415 [Achromobacter insuavis]